MFSKIALILEAIKGIASIFKTIKELLVKKKISKVEKKGESRQEILHQIEVARREGKSDEELKALFDKLLDVK